MVQTKTYIIVDRYLAREKNVADHWYPSDSKAQVMNINLRYVTLYLDLNLNETRSEWQKKLGLE